MSSDKKADFSNVQGKVTSTEQIRPQADFGNVQGSVRSTEEITGGAPSEQMYTVIKGDTLSHIAQHFYGKAGRWRRIFDANRDQLDDPDRIQPGQVLRVPADDDLHD